MLDLTRQERGVIIFLLATTLLGIGIVCYKNLRYQPKIEIVANPQVENEIKDAKIININTATKEGLMKLKGIGPSLAEAVIQHRTAHGVFRDKEEIKDVKGIGQAKYDDIKEYIKVE